MRRKSGEFQEINEGKKKKKPTKKELLARFGNKKAEPFKKKKKKSESFGGGDNDAWNNVSDVQDINRKEVYFMKRRFNESSGNDFDWMDFDFTAHPDFNLWEFGVDFDFIVEQLIGWGHGSGEEFYDYLTNRGLTDEEADTVLELLYKANGIFR